MTKENGSGGEGLSLEVMSVTPAMAERWLKKNDPNNRPISWQRVTSFANDMRDDNWKLTHQGICFNAEGMLTDGQHRLHAIVEAGKAVRMAVFTNPQSSYHDPLDRGKPRGINIILGLSSKTTAAVNMLRLMETGVFNTAPATLAEIEEIHAHHAAVFSEIDRSGIKLTGWTGGMIAAVVWAWPLDPTKVRGFAFQVSTGEMLEAASPALALRRWRERTARPSSIDMVNATCNCIRYHLVGESLGGVYVGEMGYRALTAQRRARKVPYTPSTALVEGVALTPGRHEKKLAKASEE